MIKILAFTLLISMAISFLMPGAAEAALPCPAKILDACYKSCKELFSDPLSLVSCYGGCLIACVASSID